ncbi:MAG: hypothetical protein Q7T59_01215, partial [Candidatus Woesebacteria bacterium]|nr:hypothetical protein [Candidatus Woesebacteria bacterium]
AFTYGQYAIVADNKFIGIAGSTDPVSTSIDSGALEARTRYYIFERNWFTNMVGASAALGLNSDFSTIRNNIIDMSARSAPFGGICISVSSGDTHTPTNNWVYNNTCYANQGGANQMRGVRVSSGSINTTLKNNLLYAPTATIATTIDNFLGVGPVGFSGTDGNTSDVNAKISPNFVSATPSLPPDFKITAGHAFGTGSTVQSVPTDFFGVTNSAPWDAGAVRH